jgi:hypothetical protein
MNASQFDTLVKTLPDRQSRRDVARRALAVLVSGSLGLLGAHPAAACVRKGERCGGGRGRCCGSLHCCNGTCRACCVSDDCPVPDCQRCTAKGTCRPARQGRECGTSPNSAAVIRCCDGKCPDPPCVHSGSTSFPCDGTDGSEECATVNCCVAEQPAVCPPLSNVECFCPFAQPNQSCGSDLDCNLAGTSSACICGTCQVPPP